MIDFGMFGAFTNKRTDLGLFDINIKPFISLFFNAYNGLPSPYIKDFMNNVGNDGLWKMTRTLRTNQLTPNASLPSMRVPMQSLLLLLVT